MILRKRAYAFFSHTHKAQKENMPLLDKVSLIFLYNLPIRASFHHDICYFLTAVPLFFQILAEKASLYDYELMVGDHGKRLLAFGKFAGRAGMIELLSGLGQRMYPVTNLVE